MAMTVKELQDKDTAQLQHDLLDRRRHLFALRTQAVTEKLEDPSQLRKTRKEIARILTIIHQKQSQAAKTPATTATATPVATPAAKPDTTQPAASAPAN